MSNPLQSPHPHKSTDTTSLLRGAARFLLVFLLLGVAEAALAQTSGYPGQKLLEFGRNYIIAPLGLLSIVVALAASVFRPDFVRGAVYSAIISAILFFLISSAPTLMTAMKG